MRLRWDRTKGTPEPIAALNRIHEIDNGEPLVPVLREGARLRVSRETVIPYLRQGVAERLWKAAESLPEGLVLGLIDCWRPKARQQRIYDFIYNGAKEYYPGRDHRSLRRTVCRWVAPTDQKAPPGHCTGAAVDLQLETEAGEMLDVFSPYERYSAAPTYALGLTEEAQKNRTLLVETMLQAGFSNCRDEWWHYSWGDAGWAVRQGVQGCVYGFAAMPEESYRASEILHAESLKDRPNPFTSLPG